MDNDAFKACLLDALRESGLPTIGPPPAQEILDLGSLDRSFKIYVEPMGRSVGAPFHVSGEIAWRWSSLLAARMRTTEEDFVSDLLGRHDVDDVKTAQPYLRVDIKLRATLPPGQAMAMPSPATWTKWSKESLARLEEIEPLVSENTTEQMADGRLAILAWQGEPEVVAVCNVIGQLRLQSISLAAFQMIDLPRRWDDPDRAEDPHPYEQLRAMFARVKAGLYAWGEVMDHFR